MRLVVISDTHGLHNRIEGLPDGDVLLHAGDFMKPGYDPEEIWSFNRWLGEQSSSIALCAAGITISISRAAPSKPAPFSLMPSPREYRGHHRQCLHLGIALPPSF